MSNFGNIDVLQYALDQGIIDLELVQKQMNDIQKKEILESHKYSITHGRDGKWYTYLPDAIKGRKKVKANTKEKLEDKIVSYYEEQKNAISIEYVFNEWKEDKLKHNEVVGATANRYRIDFDKYFEPIRDKPISSFGEIEIEDFIRDTIAEHEMTAKQFSNFRTVILGIFRFAKRKRYVDFSITYVLQDMAFSPNTFKKNVKRSENEVFNNNEKAVLFTYFENNKNMLTLGLLLLFKTALRVGELAALKIEDVKDGIIHVNRTEIREINGKTSNYTVRDFPKTEAGIRYVIVPTKDRWILDELLSMEHNTEYLFEDSKGNRIKTYVFQKWLRKICISVGITPKSPHKIRKTVLSELIDSGISEGTIIKMAGHKNISTTKNFYYFDRKNIEEMTAELDKVNL